jgi:phosphatidylethanolamine/phosphatidyl-N-methylethanolamine N-methyltransferase
VPDVRRVYRRWGQLPHAYDLAVQVYLAGNAAGWRRRSVDALDPGVGDRVLDLATGAGANLDLLEERVGADGSIVALDQSSEMLGRARARARAEGWDNVEFIEADATGELLPARSLDAALCTLGLTAIPDERAAIRAVHRALKPGAPFACFDVKLYGGLPTVLNPVHIPALRYTVAADVGKDVVGAIDREFGGVEVEEFRGGSLFIAVARA